MGQEEHVDGPVETSAIEQRREPLRFRVAGQEQASATAFDAQSARALVVVACEPAHERQLRLRVRQRELAGREIDARDARTELERREPLGPLGPLGMGVARRAGARARAGPQRDVEALRDPIERAVVIAIAMGEHDVDARDLPGRERRRERLARDVRPVARAGVVDPGALIRRAHEDGAAVADIEGPDLAGGRRRLPRQQHESPRRAGATQPGFTGRARASR